MTQTLRTTCNRDCPDACGILADIDDGLVVRLRGDNHHPVTQGFLCYRTSNFLERQYDPDRLTTPLFKKNGKFHPIEWETALDLVAERMLRYRKESGAASILNYRSGGSLGILKCLVDYFFEKFGPVSLKLGDICSGAGEAAQEMDYGVSDSNDLFDLYHSKAILLWGKNPYVSNVHLLPVLKEAKRRGAKLVLIDPVHHRTSKLCDHYVQLRPGGDFALAMGMARALFESGSLDATAEHYCDHFEPYKHLVFSRSLAAWAQLADVEEEQVRELASWYVDRGPAAILVGWGMQRRANGAGIVRALDALGAISGNLGIAGGGVSFYFQRKAAFHTDFIKGLDAAPRSLPETHLGQALVETRDPEVRMVWISNGNPVAMLPDSERVAEGLKSREFVVVVDSFMTDTAQVADLILPTTTMLEDHDLVGAYGHHWLGAVRPVVEAPNGVKTDLAIVQALAQRVGLEKEMQGTPEEWQNRILGKQSEASLQLENFTEGYPKSPVAKEVLFQGRVFPTATGRVQLMQAEPPRLPGLSAEYPLYLMALATDRAQASQMTKHQQDGWAEATVHPHNAAGMRTGEIALLETEMGRMHVRLKLDERQRKDVVLLPKGGWHSRERCANALIRAASTDLGHGAAYYDQPARIRPPETAIS